MDARSLHQFVTVVELGTMGRAADALHMTQSALTKSIQRLEHALQVPLLERGRSGVRPTAFGLAVMPFARSVGLQTMQLRNAVAAVKAGKAGRVVLGAGPSLVANIVPRAIVRAAELAPNLQVEVVEGVVSSLIPRLQAGELDFFIGTAAAQSLDRQLKAERLFDDRILIVAGKTHPVHRKRRLALADLSALHWALPDAGHSLTTGCAKLFQDAGLPAPVPAVVTSSLSCLEALLMAGTHISVAPESTRPWARNAFVPVRVEGGCWRRAIWLYRRAGHTHSPAASAMIEALRAAHADA